MGKLGDAMLASCDELVKEAAFLASDDDIGELQAWAPNLWGSGGLTCDKMRAKTSGVSKRLKHPPAAGTTGKVCAVGAAACCRPTSTTCTSRQGEQS